MRLPEGRRVPLVLACGLLSSCGAGVVAVAASSGSSGGGTTPALDSFVVESPKVSRARLRLDASQAVRVGLFYDFGQGERPMSTLRDALQNEIDGNEVDLTASEVRLDWDFANEPGGTAAFTPGVRLMAKHGGAVISGGELTLGLGNDAPEVLSIDEIDIDPDEGEASGTTGIELTVSDTSGDVVSVQVEFDIVGDVPDAEWQLARQDLLDPADPTPPFGIDHVQVASGGTQLAFHWDTDFDLEDLERDVRLRFTATDFDEHDEEVDSGQPVESTVFRVDNNAPPIVQLQNDAVIANPDERRGIPIPFRVIDEEGDLVEVIFQWRREGEEFPSLDRDGDGKIENTEVDEILADPILRREHNVCSEYPHHAQGRVIPIDQDTVRLSELASSESWILAGGIVGRTLELVRPSSIPAPITPTWRSNPLASPVAALSNRDGLNALVLDVPGQGRLREIELATGEIVREIATLGPGIPSAMAFERREKAVLVALDDAGTWRIERVDLASGAITELVVSDGTEPAPVRGIASLGSKALAFTAGSSLVHLDYRDALAPRLGRVLCDLATPWGVVVDPLSEGRIYVAERDANRVLAVELDAHGTLPVVVKTEALEPGALEAPRALALERNGARMLVVTRSPGGGDQLVGVDLGATGGNRSFAIGSATAGDLEGLATGADGLRLLLDPGTSSLIVGGGVEQRRVISAHATGSNDVAVDRPFDPVPAPGRPWRIPEERAIRARAQGVSRRFLWDSSDALSGSVLLRAIVRDAELGATSDSTAPKRLRGEAERTLGGPGITDGPRDVAAADLDGDGDVDLVSANALGNDLTVFFQDSPGAYSAPPLSLGGLPATNRPSDVTAADLDGDGDLDLVSANENSGNTVFFQASLGVFDQTPLVLSEGRYSVAAGDLDGDCDLDLVSASRSGNGLSVFFQLSPGEFSSTPLTLGDSTTAGGVPAMADLDGDGDLDLLASAIASTHNLTVFFQVSPGSFSAAPLALGDPGTTRPGSIVVADLDVDGDQDLAFGHQQGLGGENGVKAFLQVSPGTFADIPLILGSDGTELFPRSVAAADLDGDGDQDLLAADAFDGVKAFPQSSPGNFGGTPLEFGTGSGFTSVTAADLDGDGDQDLVSASFQQSELTLFFQDSPGPQTDALLTIGSVPATLEAIAVVAADLDGDGLHDLASAHHAISHLTVSFQSSVGAFQDAPLMLGDIDTTRFPVSVAAADLDGDGDLDLASANVNEPVVNLHGWTLFFQDSPGAFVDAPLTLGRPGTTDSPTWIALADLDGDGDADVVSANADSNDLTIFHQLDQGTFASAPVTVGGIPATNRPIFVAVADVDGDGALDLVATNQGRDVTIFFQLAGGTFAAEPLTLGGLPTTNFPNSAVVADLDGDGDQDIASANGVSNNLTIFFHWTPGSFASSPFNLGGLPTTNGPVSLSAGDLDADGDQDLVSANHLGNDLTVFFQLSPGTFATTPLVLGGSGTTDRPSSVTIADLDGDGDPEVVSANYTGNNLTVFFGGR